MPKSKSAYDHGLRDGKSGNRYKNTYWVWNDQAEYKAGYFDGQKLREHQQPK